MRCGNSLTQPELVGDQPTNESSLSALPLCHVLVAALPTDLRLGLQSSSCGRALLSSPQLLSKVVPILRSQPQVVLKQLCALDSSMLLVSLRRLCNLKPAGIEQKSGFSVMENQAQTSPSVEKANSSVKPDQPALPASPMLAALGPPQRKARELRQGILYAIGATSENNSEEPAAQCQTRSPVTSNQGHLQGQDTQQGKNACTQRALRCDRAGGLSPTRKTSTDGINTLQVQSAETPRAEHDSPHPIEAVQPSDRRKLQNSPYAARLMHYAQSKKLPKAGSQECGAMGTHIVQQPCTSARQEQSVIQQSPGNLAIQPQKLSMDSNQVAQETDPVLQSSQPTQPEPPKIPGIVGMASQPMQGAQLPSAVNSHVQSPGQLSDQASRLHCLLINPTSRHQFCSSLPLLNPADKTRLMALLHQIHSLHPYLYPELNEVWHHAMWTGGSQVPVQGQIPLPETVATQPDNAALGLHSNNPSQSLMGSTKQQQQQQACVQMQASVTVPTGCPTAPAMPRNVSVLNPPANNQVSHAPEMQTCLPHSVPFDSLQAAPQISRACDLLSPSMAMPSHTQSQRDERQQSAVHDSMNSPNDTIAGSDSPVPLILTSRVVGYGAPTQPGSTTNKQQHHHQGVPGKQGSQCTTSMDDAGKNTKNWFRQDTDGGNHKPTSLALQPYVSGIHESTLPMTSTANQGTPEGTCNLLGYKDCNPAADLSRAVPDGPFDDRSAFTEDSTQAAHTAEAVQESWGTAVRVQEVVVKQPAKLHTGKRIRSLPNGNMQLQARKRQSREQTQSALCGKQTTPEGRTHDISSLKKQLMPELMKACSIDYEEPGSDVGAATQYVPPAPQLNEETLIELASILTGSKSAKGPEVQTVLSRWVTLAAMHARELATSACDNGVHRLARTGSEHSMCSNTQASRQVAHDISTPEQRAVDFDSPKRPNNRPDIQGDRHASEESNIMSQSFRACCSDLSTAYESHHALAEQVASLFRVPTPIAQASNT